MQDGKVLYEEYFGREGRAAETAPVGADSRFPCFSISKGFCSALVLALASDGIISLDDPVAKYLPYFTGSGPGGKFLRERVTVRMLAAHSGGVPRDDTPPRTWAGGVEPFADVVLESEPGTTFLYSELGMRLLGHTLATAAGKPFDQLLRERVLEPLGLSNTGWLSQGDSLSHIIETFIGPDTSYIHYSDEFSPSRTPAPDSTPRPARSAAMASFSWIKAWPGRRRIFSPEFLEQAWVTQPSGRAADPDYGILFWLFPRQGAAVFSGAAHTICCILPEQRMVLVQGLNQRDGGAGWDYEAEKENLARVGLALDEMLHPRAAKGIAAERPRER